MNLMPKLTIQFLLCFFLIQGFSLRMAIAEKASEDKEGGAIIETSEAEDMIEKLTDIPDVKPIIEKYKKDHDGAIDWADLWKGFGPDIQDKITKKLEEGKFLKGKPSSNKKTTTVEHLSNFKKTQASPEKVLQEYLKKRLHEALFDNKDKRPGSTKALSNHAILYNLYRSQVGKNLINELAKYCLYADENGKVHLKDVEKSLGIKKKNLEDLKLYGQKKEGKAATSFDLCMPQIASSCVKEKKQEVPKGLPIPHPCEINRYMTQARMTINNLEELEGELKIQTKRTNKDGVRFSGFGTEKKDFNSNKIINISSKELVEDSGYKEAAEQEAERIKVCAEEAGASAECQNLLTEESDNEETLDEFALRNIAAQKKIEKKVLESEDEEEQVAEYRKYLKSQEVEDANIDKAIEKMQAKDKGLTAAGALKKLVLDRFESERIALHKSLKAKLETTQAGKDATDEVKVNKLEEMSKSIESSPTALAEVYHYANVVTSFIDIKSEGSETTSKNTAALAVELEGNFFAPGADSEEGTSPVTPNDISDLAEFGEEPDSKEGTQGGNTVLSGSEIDGIQY